MAPQRRHTIFHAPHFSIGVGRRRVALPESEVIVTENHDRIDFNDIHDMNRETIAPSDCLADRRVAFLSARPDLGTDQSVVQLQRFMHERYGLPPNAGDESDDSDCLVTVGHGIPAGSPMFELIESHSLRNCPLVSLAASGPLLADDVERSRSMLGVRFEPIGDYAEIDVAEPVRVRVPGESRRHPTVQDVMPFSTGPLDTMALPCRPDVTPLLYGFTGELAVPLAWATEHSGSRVFHTSLGTVADFRIDSFLQLTANALLWAMEIY